MRWVWHAPPHAPDRLLAGLWLPIYANSRTYAAPSSHHKMETDLLLQAAKPIDMESARASPAVEERVKVLLIEDNPGDARLIQLMLEEAGSQLFEIEHVGRLEQGLKRHDGGCNWVMLMHLTTQ